MSRKVAPQLVVNTVQKNDHQNSSINSINGSFLHEGYLAQDQNQVSRCCVCNKSSAGSFISACDCYGKFYHQECLKKWLTEQLLNSNGSVKSVDSHYELECRNCGHFIKFKAN